MNETFKYSIYIVYDHRMDVLRLINAPGFRVEVTLEIYQRIRTGHQFHPIQERSSG